jgi:tetratricopeptide (TPR) repeat protein
MGQRKAVFALAVACALTTLQAQAADAMLDQAYKYMQTGNAKAAYALLEPEESNRAGDKDFDFMFALAALDVGQNTRAIFALERVLAVDPNNTRARAELGRAYLGVGEANAARTELQTVKDLGVPDEVARSINNILDAVDRIDSEGKTVIRGYIEGTIGYDTNVNASTSLGTVAVPALGGISVILDPSSVAQRDGFASIGGGISFRTPINKEWAVLGNASGSQRMNFSVDNLDQLNTDFNLGLVNNQGKNVYSLTAQAGTLRVDSDRFRDVYGVTGQWQHNIDARNQVSAYAQYSDLEYVGQSARDADRWVLGAAYAHALRDGSLLFGSLYSVREDNQSSFSELSFDGWGLRFGAQTNLYADMVLFANAGIEHRKHDGEDSTFLVIRKDNQSNVNIGVTYAMRRDLKVTSQFQYTNQSSDIPLYDYDRVVMSVTVRKDF